MLVGIARRRADIVQTGGPHSRLDRMGRVSRSGTGPGAEDPTIRSASHRRIASIRKVDVAARISLGGSGRLGSFVDYSYYNVVSTVVSCISCIWLQIRGTIF